MDIGRRVAWRRWTVHGQVLCGCFVSDKVSYAPHQSMLPLNLNALTNIER
jgi:hypothetical protein